MVIRQINTAVHMEFADWRATGKLVLSYDTVNDPTGMDRNHGVKFELHQRGVPTHECGLTGAEADALLVALAAARGRTLA